MCAKNRRILTPGLAALLALLAPLAALGGESPPPPGPAAGLRDGGPTTSRSRPENVLLVTVDTTRADHLSCYGYGIRTSPHIDALASTGIRFADASSVVPLTGPGHATLMTGLVPRDHGAVRNGVRIRPEVPTLAQIASQIGMQTAAFISGWTLSARITGLDHGFDTYDDEMTDRYRLVNHQRWGDQTTDRALDWLDAHGDTPFFLWVHLFDPHEPYRSHDLDLAPVPGAAPVKRSGRVADYDQEIAFADAQIGRLLAALVRKGLRDRTLVVLTADHGEAFGEHGENGHGRRLYQTTQHVPLILAYPSLGQGIVPELPVSTLDVFPTILGMLEQSVPPALEGIRLDEAIHDSSDAQATREIYMETFHGARKKFWHIFGPSLTGDPLYVAVRRGRWKAILDPHDGHAELFDLSTDPGETVDVAADQSYRLRRFMPQLTSYARKAWRSADSPQELTGADRKKLEALGYVN
ncbi:MAG: sulfatase [Acidobacteriota bacterium]